MASTKHHILLVGGTGICGQIFTNAALQAGHKLTLYVRTPSKLPAEITSHANITIIQGTLDDEAGLQNAASCTADIFISFAGPTLGRREGTPITTALKRFYPLLLKANPHIRILVLSTASYSAPQDTRSIKWFLAINAFIRVVGGDSYPEITGISQVTTSLGDEVEWTLFRVPLLHGTGLSEEQIAAIKTLPSGGGEGSGGEREGKSANEVNAKVNAAFVGDKDGKDWLLLDRGRLALWVLGEIEEKRWVRKCPTLGNA